VYGCGSACTCRSAVPASEAVPCAVLSRRVRLWIERVQMAWRSPQKDEQNGLGSRRFGRECLAHLPEAHGHGKRCSQLQERPPRAAAAGSSLKTTYVEHGGFSHREKRTTDYSLDDETSTPPFLRASSSFFWSVCLGSIRAVTLPALKLDVARSTPGSLKTRR